MNFADAATVALADPATRGPLFDEAALARIAAAAFDLGAMPLAGPLSAAFDEVELGASVPRSGAVEGTWQALGGGDRHEARFLVSGLGPDPVRIDALWRGRIVARTTPPSGRIEEVAVAPPDLGAIDAAIAAEPGGLPADPEDLEAARRAELADRLRATAADAAVIDDAFIDRLLASARVDSVGALIAAGYAQPTTVRVTFSDPAAVPASPTALPIAAAILVRDAGFSLVALLTDSKLVRQRLADQGFGPPRGPRLPRRREVVVVWLVPAAVFDDADWPGAAAGMTTAAARAARIDAAGAWLAREGIGLVAAP